MDGGPKIDTAEKVIRFVCGSFLGAMIGFGLILREAPMAALGAYLGTASASAVICGGLAMRMGDRFWHSFGERSGSSWLDFFD